MLHTSKPELVQQFVGIFVLMFWGTGVGGWRTVGLELLQLFSRSSGLAQHMWPMKLFSISVGTSEVPLRWYKQGRATLAL